jgi:ABC-type uncharacterized transport system involved in gliding motility auxiliary subunit
MRRRQQLLYSGVGLAALFLALIALNYLAAQAPGRLDLTQGRLYTLSDGTKKILRGLEAPVKIRLYISHGERAMPVTLRSFAQRVEDLVHTFKAVAGNRLVIEKYDPEPDSDQEDAAQLDGVEPQQLISGEQFYLGLTVSRLDRKQAIPALSPARERLLEYDLARAIADVANPQRPVIGVMSALPVLGEAFNPFTRQSAEPWVFANELKREFDVRPVGMNAAAIDKDIKVLLVIHPRDITPLTEYAIDQFVLRGGRLVAFVDPYAYFDPMQGPMAGMGGGGTSSTLPRLLKAWGVGMDTGKVVSDIVFASGTGQRYTPTVLTLNRTAFNRSDVVTSQIETLLYAFGGAFDVKPAAGLTATDLVASSPNSMRVDRTAATTAGDAATRDFKPGGKRLTLALRLHGRFRTAFPDGPPKPAGAKDDAARGAAAPQLRESAKDNAVVLVADSDMLNDAAAVDVQEVFGRHIVVPSNGNLAFAQGVVEQLAAGDALISLHSRASAFRPLTVVREMEARAQQQYFGKIQALESELQKTTQKMEDLQKARGAVAKNAQILSLEQQAELDRFRHKVAVVRRELKELRKTLRRDAEALVFWTKVGNIALMPLLVALAGLIVALVRRRRQAQST